MIVTPHVLATKSADYCSYCSSRASTPTHLQYIAMPTPSVCVTILRNDELRKVSKFGTYLNKQTLYVDIRISTILSMAYVISNPVQRYKNFFK